MPTSTMSFLDLMPDDPIVKQIVREAQGVDTELCGVLVPTLLHGSHIVILPNRSPFPHSQFHIRGEDLRLALEGWLEANDTELWTEVVFWHTHPGGGIGPSTTDLQNKPKGARSLVIALTKDGPVLTFY